MEANQNTSDESATEYVQNGFTFSKAADCTNTIEQVREGGNFETERGDKIKLRYKSATTGYENITEITGRIVRFKRQGVTIVRDSDNREMTLKSHFGHTKTEWHSLDVRTEGRLVGVVEQDALNHGISLLRPNYEEVEVETDGGNDKPGEYDVQEETEYCYYTGEEGNYYVSKTGKATRHCTLCGYEGTLSHPVRRRPTIEAPKYHHCPNPDCDVRMHEGEHPEPEEPEEESDLVVLKQDEKGETVKIIETETRDGAEAICDAISCIGGYQSEIKNADEVTYSNMDKAVEEIANIEAVTDFAAGEKVIIVGVEGDVDEPPEKVVKAATQQGFKRDKGHTSDRILEYYGFDTYETNFVFATQAYDPLITDGGTQQTDEPRVTVNDPQTDEEATAPFKALDAQATDLWVVELHNGERYKFPNTFRVAVDGSASVTMVAGTTESFTVDDIARIEWYGDNSEMYGTEFPDREEEPDATLEAKDTRHGMIFTWSWSDGRVTVSSVENDEMCSLIDEARQRFSILEVQHNQLLGEVWMDGEYVDSVEWQGGASE